MTGNNQDNSSGKKFDSANFGYNFDEKDLSQNKGFMEFQEKNKKKLPDKDLNQTQKVNIIKTPEELQKVIEKNYEHQQLLPQFIKPQVSLNFSGQKFYYRQYEEIKKTNQENDTKIIAFKDRLKHFDNVSTITEARELSKKVLPVKSEINTFDVGKAKCTVINKSNLFRITFESDEEIICYDFVQ